MNKEELLKEFNSKVEDLRQELLEKLKSLDEKKSFEVDLPDNGKKFHFIDNTSCDIDHLYYREKLASHEMRWKNGMLFESREEAEQRLRESELLFRMRKWAEIHNEGWKPDWADMRQSKYFVVCDMYANDFFIHNAGVFKYMTNDLPYFKTNEVARQFIKEFGKEIKEVLL